MSDGFWKYFDYSTDYPDNIGFDPLPLGTCYNYVSQTFLNGFINYVKIQKAFVLNRYIDWSMNFEEEDNGEPVELKVMEPKSYEYVTKICKNKDEVFKCLTFYSEPHTNLSQFQDDVMILSKAFDPHDGNNDFVWIFFWFDQDVSDCSIGRFITTDTDEEVINKFTKLANKNYNFGENTARELENRFINGWKSF